MYFPTEKTSILWHAAVAEVKPLTRLFLKVKVTPSALSLHMSAAYLSIQISLSEMNQANPVVHPCNEGQNNITNPARSEANGCLLELIG